MRANGDTWNINTFPFKFFYDSSKNFSDYRSILEAYIIAHASQCIPNWERWQNMRMGHSSNKVKKKQSTFNFTSKTTKNTQIIKHQYIFILHSHIWIQQTPTSPATKRHPTPPHRQMNRPRTWKNLGKFLSPRKVDTLIPFIAPGSFPPLFYSATFSCEASASFSLVSFVGQRLPWYQSVHW